MTAIGLILILLAAALHFLHSSFSLFANAHLTISGMSLTGDILTQVVLGGLGFIVLVVGLASSPQYQERPSSPRGARPAAPTGPPTFREEFPDSQGMYRVVDGNFRLEPIEGMKCPTCGNEQAHPRFSFGVGTWNLQCRVCGSRMGLDTDPNGDYVLSTEFERIEGHGTTRRFPSWEPNAALAEAFCLGCNANWTPNSPRCAHCNVDRLFCAPNDAELRAREGGGGSTNTGETNIRMEHLYLVVNPKAPCRVCGGKLEPTGGRIFVVTLSSKVLLCERCGRVYRESDVPIVEEMIKGFG